MAGVNTYVEIGDFPIQIEQIYLYNFIYLFDIKIFISEFEPIFSQFAPPFTSHINSILAFSSDLKK
jgi:hypothetical protein